MKRIISFFVFILFGTILYSQTVNYIYNSKGDKVYFHVNSNIKYFKFTDKLSNAKKSDFFNELGELSSTALEQVGTDIFKISIEQNKEAVENLLSNSEILEFCSSEMIYMQDSTVQWADKYIFIHSKENYSIDSLLNSLNILYSNIDTASHYLPNQYIIEIKSENAVDCANRLFETGKFVYSQPAFYRVNKVQNSLYHQQLGLNNTGQFGDSVGIDINVECAWNITNGDPSIRVAILGDGVDLDHIDLAENIIYGVDLLDSGTFGGYLGNDYGGTSRAGVIAAVDNNIGIKGIANKCKILPIRIQQGFDTIADCHYVKALTYAIDSADIISCAPYHGSESEGIRKEIDNAYLYGRNGKGCVVVATVGGMYNHIGSSLSRYPANLENVIGVGTASPCGERKTASSCDGDTTWSSNYGSALDVVAPGVNIMTTDIDDNFALFSNNIVATDHVSGVAALILSVNPNLTSAQVKNIIEQTAQKIRPDLYIYTNTSVHPNGIWNDSVGYGLVDACAAVRAALGVDLYTRDSVTDNGAEPNNIAIENVKNSPDIWLRKYANTGNGHQSGLNGGINHVYIRINNRGEGSLGTDTVELYTRKAGLGAFFWNSGWTKVGTACIPSIPAGSSATVRISGTFPNYNRFPLAWNSPNMEYALLTRIKSNVDTMTFTEGTNLLDNVHKNNNISYKNVTMSDAMIVDDGIVTDVVITAFDNPTDGLFRTSLTFSSPANEEGNPLFKEAEIRLIFPKTLVQSWGSSYILSGAKKVNDSTFLITGSTAKMENISIPANYEGYMMAQVNFLTEEYSEKDKYEYIVEQADPTTGEYQNGLVMIVDKTLRSNLFMAEGGNNVVANANTPANLSATAIGEDAVYNWYNASGVLVNSGQNISVTSSATEKYTLEVIAKADGYKDYDSVYVIRTLGNIVDISPNPTSGHTVVTYNLASSVSAASIVVTNSSGLAVYSSAIDVSATTHTLNVQNLVAGQYSVRLVSATGEVLDSKTLIVQ